MLISLAASTAVVFLCAQDGQLYALNLIDTPGHVDFTYEVRMCINTLGRTILLQMSADGIQQLGEVLSTAGTSNGRVTLNCCCQQTADPVILKMFPDLCLPARSDHATWSTVHLLARHQLMFTILP
jgi:hypothetical protein